MFEKEAAEIGLKVCVNCHTENEWLTGQCVKCGCTEFREQEEIREAQKNGIMVGFVGLILIGISGLLGIGLIQNHFFGSNHLTPQKAFYGLVISAVLFPAGLVFLYYAYNLIKYKKGHYFVYMFVFLSYAVEIILLYFLK